LRLDYTYGATNNNGNVQTQRIVIAGSLDVTQTYTYDELNRLKTANESNGANWSQTYGFDRFGNRWVSASTGYTLSPLTPTAAGAFNTANNRLFASGYDSAGNQTTDAQSRSFTYDGENRQITFNGTAGQYFYDGDGNRVKKIDGSGTTVFVFNAGGQLIAEYHGDPVPPAAGGGGTSYLTSDHLGSTRVVTDSLGVVKARYDYLPFGEELPSSVGGRDAVGGYGGADSTRQKFTQKERDSESGLDYFLARYYSSPQGRFTSTDRIIVTSERLVDPQEINLYNYARNNPLRFTDPTGEDIDDSSLNKNKNYQGWKKAYLSTNAGRSEWDKYANDHSITITISMGTNAGGKEGAETTPTFDSKGRLTSATIVLGTNFAKNDRLDSTDYPVTSSLVQSAEHSNSTIDRTTRAVDFLAHEFGHVDDDQKQGALWVQQTELMKQNLEGYGKEGQAWFNTSQYQKIVSELGDTPANISTQREVRADGAVIPVLRDYYAKGAGHGSMPSRVKQAIQNYEKAHPR
jgi:RHS repeat-associated protein